MTGKGSVTIGLRPDSPLFKDKVDYPVKPGNDRKKWITRSSMPHEGFRKGLVLTSEREYLSTLRKSEDYLNIILVEAVGIEPTSGSTTFRPLHA